MNTDDLLCVGCVDNIFVSSTIGRNKALIPGEVLSAHQWHGGGSGDFARVWRRGEVHGG